MAQDGHGRGGESVAGEALWRPSPHQHRIDPELAAMLPLTVEIPFEQVDRARELEAQRTAESFGREALTLEAAVESRNDAIVRTGAPDVPIRIYRPKFGSQGLGAFVFFHGGGFALGTLDSEHNRCAYLAKEAECVVVSVGYRLAPEHKFPAGFDDCFDAVVWVAENARELGVVPGRLAVGGASAGGALAAGVALRARDEEAPLLSFQLLIYPVLDLRMKTPSMEEFSDAPTWDAVSNRAMWEYYLPVDDEAVGYASPALADNLDGLPPTMITAAELDCLRDEAVEYALALSRAGVPVELHMYPGAFHGFDLAAPHAEISQRTLVDQARALGKALRRQPRTE
jgi:acetyl esterase/lipase